ncbi:MAG: toll/interleukin-1 receptor domain-containing protein, partial [Candidatus Methanoperedens sp.]|nr:toll/interleukin-1 receptor domain-containing protein [Candidatus Methanoperedens sp.]
MTIPTVFISYSHKDEEWKDRLYPHLGMLENVTIWDDRKIDPDGRWFNEIKPIIDRAAAAVCLISADYLATRFCKEQEIPYLLERREKEGMIIIPVLIRPCQWWIFSWLKKVQVLPRDGDHEKRKYKYVATDFEKKYDEIFLEVGESIYNIISDPKYRAPEPVLRWQPPEKIDIHRLPMTGEELFGRQKQLEMLDKAWDSSNTRIISLVAWGGVGKSTLVNKWLEHMASDNYRGARRVYAWSFHSQGTGERVTSADLFFAEALAWFGDPDPTKGSPWDKGERLAELIRKEKTLLILDGLEPLQSPYDYERGKLKDPGMATLLSELARRNSGICIITSREEVSDLSLFNTACKIDLEQFSDEAGRALLRISGV